VQSHGENQRQRYCYSLEQVFEPRQNLNEGRQAGAKVEILVLDEGDVGEQEGAASESKIPNILQGLGVSSGRSWEEKLNHRQLQTMIWRKRRS
jgi:hypothetical protein